jgi:hypothetical protein
VIAVALAALTALGGCSVERIASIRVVAGMPFVQALRPDVRVTRRRMPGGSAYVVMAGTRRAAQIDFAPTGITVAGVVGSDDPHRVDVYAARGRCTPSTHAQKRFDPQTGLVSS